MRNIMTERERNLRYKDKDVIYFDVDYLLNVEGINNLSELEFNYVKCITHIFLGNLGYGKTWGNDELNNLRNLFNLKYTEINIRYKGNEYKIKVSNKSGNHGKIIGFNSYTLSFDRPNPEPINDFDILLDMRWLNSLKHDKDAFIQFFDVEVGSQVMAHSKIQSGRNFLESNFKLNIDEILGSFLSYHFICKQEGYLIEELKPLVDVLTSNGYYYKVQLNEDTVNSIKGGNMNQDLGLRVKVYSVNNNKESLKGSYLFLETFVYMLWDIYLDFLVVSSLKNSKNREVTIGKHFRY